jgi:hypothetical protein
MKEEYIKGKITSLIFVNGLKYKLFFVVLKLEIIVPPIPGVGLNYESLSVVL